jgi:hypothetical protein
LNSGPLRLSWPDYKNIENNPMQSSPMGGHLSIGARRERWAECGRAIQSQFITLQLKAFEILT